MAVFDVGQRPEPIELHLVEEVGVVEGSETWRRSMGESLGRDLNGLNPETSIADQCPRL